MKITACYLDSANPLPIDGVPLGSMVLAAGKDHLWEERKQGDVDVIVLHYISASGTLPKDPFNFESILKIFCDYGVSSHFIINRRGRVFQLVPFEKKAWHCGGSIMPEPDNRQGVNEFSVGIELVATQDSGFTAAQYRSAAMLCARLEIERKKSFVYTGHDLIAGVRAVELGLRRDEKCDPGRLFDWKLFHKTLETGRKSLS